jgi:hypothetical protein
VAPGARKTSRVPPPQAIAALPLVDRMIVSRVNVAGAPAVRVPMPFSMLVPERATYSTAHGPTLSPLSIAAPCTRLRAPATSPSRS